MLELFVSWAKGLIALCLFRNSLVSTDATARGIDFGGAKCVISYDAPQFIRTYIHRYFSRGMWGGGLGNGGGAVHLLTRCLLCLGWAEPLVLGRQAWLSACSSSSR